MQKQYQKLCFLRDGNEADFFKMPDLSYLAGFQYLKHQRQPLCDELFCVLFFLNGLEFLEQALDEGSSVLLEGRAQGLQPCVQCPGNTYRQRTELISSFTEGYAFLLFYLYLG